MKLTRLLMSLFYWPDVEITECRRSEIDEFIKANYRYVLIGSVNNKPLLPNQADRN